MGASDWSTNGHLTSDHSQQQILDQKDVVTEPLLSEDPSENRHPVESFYASQRVTTTNDHVHKPQTNRLISTPQHPTQDFIELLNYQQQLMRQHLQDQLRYQEQQRLQAKADDLLNCTLVNPETAVEKKRQDETQHLKKLLDNAFPLSHNSVLSPSNASEITSSSGDYHMLGSQPLPSASNDLLSSSYSFAYVNENSPSANERYPSAKKYPPSANENRSVANRKLASANEIVQAAKKNFPSTSDYLSSNNKHHLSIDRNVMDGPHINNSPSPIKPQGGAAPYRADSSDSMTTGSKTESSSESAAQRTEEEDRIVKAVQQEMRSQGH